MHRDRSLIRLYFALLTVVYLGVYPYLQAINNPNENTRVYLVMALVDHGTWKLDPIVKRFGWTNDMARVPDSSAPGGTHLAAVKGPAMTYAGVPVYVAQKLVLRVFGMRPPDDASTPSQASAWLRTTTLTLELFCAHLPCLAFLMWFERRLRRWSRDVVLRLSAVSAVGLGSNYLAYSFVFVSHATSAAVVFVALSLIAEERLHARGAPARARPLRALYAGLAVGLVTLLEYQGLFLTVVLALYALSLFRTARTLGAFTLGALVNVALLCLFQWASFGNALTPGHRMMETTAFRALQNQGLFGITAPHLDALRGLLFDQGYGLFPSTPFLLAGIAGSILSLAPVAARWRRERRLFLLVAAALVVVLTLSIASAVMWRGGWTIGPRYLAVAPPLLAMLGLWALEQVARGSARRRWLARAVASGAALASFALGGAIGLVVSTLPESIVRPVPQILLPLLRISLVPHHALELVGISSAWPFWVVLGSSLLAVLVVLWPKGESPGRAVGRGLLSLLVAAALVTNGLLLPRDLTDEGPATRALFYDKWEPRGRDQLARARADALSDPCAFTRVARGEELLGQTRAAALSRERAALCGR